MELLKKYFYRQGSSFYKKPVKSLTLPFLLFFLSGWISATVFNPLSLSKDMVQCAEQLLGLQFTDAERDSMLSGLEDNLKKYENIRQYTLTNDVPPALGFDPVPEGFTLKHQKQNPLIFSDYSNTSLPQRKDDLAYYSIGQLASLIRSKKISCRELTGFYIARLKKHDPVLHAVITLTEELAIKKAVEMDKEIAAGRYRGMLHGIPYGLKDLFAVKGYTTTWGSVPYKSQVIDLNSTVFKKLDEAGAVLVAKLTMGELAMGDVWFGGITRNPWDVTQGSSGSSAGSASTVSAGLLPFAIGTETWGSIVSPSTICGVTGLRPTYGRVSRAGAMALSWSMDKPGPICRNAEDCAIVFDAIRGEDGIDLSVKDAAFNYSAMTGIKKLRIGYLRNYFAKKYELRDNDSLMLESIRKMGIKMEAVDFETKLPISSLSIILDAEAGAAFDELTRSNRDDMLVRQTKYAWPNYFRTARFTPAVEYVNANRLRTLLIREFNALMKNYDVLIAPSLHDDLQLLTNLTGHPCIAIPDGFTKPGMPTSITLVGNLYDEAAICMAAYKIQLATGHHLKHPGM